MDATPTTITPPAEQVGQGEPPPGTVAQQQPSTAAHGQVHGSVGAVIGVLAVIAVLGIVAGMVGRLCSGRSMMGYGGDFDGESWVEAKCSSCVDGTIGPPPPRLPPRLTVDPEADGGGRGNMTPVAPTTTVNIPAMNTGEIKTEENEEQRERESSEEEQQQGYNQNHEHSHSHS